MLNTNIFAAFDILWGPHTVDRFASFRSREIPRFNSKWLSPATEGIDAFTISWKNENNWLFSPPASIPKVLKHMEGGGEHGTLIVPRWKYQLPGGHSSVQMGYTHTHLSSAGR